jgi:hypothetical protein
VTDSNWHSTDHVFVNDLTTMLIEANSETTTTTTATTTAESIVDESTTEDDSSKPTETALDSMTSSEEDEDETTTTTDFEITATTGLAEVTTLASTTAETTVAITTTVESVLSTTTTLDNNVKLEIMNYTVLQNGTSGGGSSGVDAASSSKSPTDSKTYSLRLHIKGFKWNEKYNDPNSQEAQSFLKAKILPLLFKNLNLKEDDLNEIKLIRLFKGFNGLNNNNNNNNAAGTSNLLSGKTQ